ncbi:Uma2 family endonuclease [Nocardiopsis baichengensis]|uniref:Uma2 family endonuclease n=1 Tax=Nocardiopsis baichengensis TaxID=280240 RepID=UPI00035E91F6|nr:Uma2 family endonuclease [Nocardiopsis baichengensis]
MSAPLPDWVIPPHEGFSADEFLQMSQLPPHTELIDGSLIFVSPQKWWHIWVINLLEAELDRQAPQSLRACREMAVRLGERQVPELDVVVVGSGVFERESPDTYFYAADVTMAVEVVSPESALRDKASKPRIYAEAGIPHFWRVENEDGRPVAYTYRLDSELQQYALTGIHHGRFKLGDPFPLDIDLDQYKRRGAGRGA